jgi:hypothetical protein
MRIIIFLGLLLPGLALGQFARRQTGVSGGGSITPVLPNSIGCYGDSIIAGACSVINPCVRVSNAIPGSSSSNDGVSGYTAAQISTCYFTGVGGVCDPYSTQCVGEACGTLIIQGGVNSLKAPGAVTGVVEQETLDEMQPIVVNALSRGRRVVWVGVLPYASCDLLTCPILVDPDQRATTYNALMMSACTALQGTYGSALLKCVSPYDQFEDPPGSGDLASEYACSDGIHLDDQAGKTGPQTLACDILIALGYACP